jgi:hypothetical protein
MIAEGYSSRQIEDWGNRVKLVGYEYTRVIFILMGNINTGHM